MKLFYKIPFMRLSLSILFLVFISINSNYAQSTGLSTWYPLKTVENSYFSYNISSSKVSEEEARLSNLPKDITKVQYTKLTLSRGNGSASNIRSVLFGIRGQINNREVLIIDENLDRNISDREVIYLPDLSLVDSIPYNSLYAYPTNFNHIVELEYDHILNNQVIRIPHSFVITVHSKYDTISNKLYYTDMFRAGHLHKLRCEIGREAKSFAIETDNKLPWQTLYTFTLEQQDFRSKLSFKETFNVHGDPNIYFIDSIDIINKRILISIANEIRPFTISGTPINLETTIDTELLKHDFTLIHFWGTWCVPCIKNMPKIKDIHGKYKDLGIIGVAVGGGKTKTLDFIEKNTLNWPNLYFETEEELSTKSNLEVLSFPTYVLVDKERKIIGKWNTIEDLMKELKNNY